MTMRLRNCAVGVAVLALTGWAFAAQPVFSSGRISEAEQRRLVGGVGGKICTVGAGTCTACVPNTCGVNGAATACTTVAGAAGCGAAGVKKGCVTGPGTCSDYYGGVVCGGPKQPDPCVPTAWVLRANGQMAINACGAACSATTSIYECSDCQ